MQRGRSRLVRLSGRLVASIGHAPAIVLAGPHGGGIVNLPAVLVALTVAGLLIAGTRESATLNILLVVIKLSALAAFVLFALPAFDAGRLTRFMPYGFGSAVDAGGTTRGVMAAAAIVFFAFYGFDAVATSAEEARNSGRDLKIGIIGSMALCTLIYILVAVCAVGAIDYRLIGHSAEPLALVLRTLGHGAVAWAVALAELVALPSVILVMMYGQSRIFFVMARDGLLPSALSRVSTRTGSPIVITALTGVLVAVVAGFFRLDEIAELANAGTLLAFIVVAACMMILRRTRPDLPRVFRCPAPLLIGSAAIIGCVYLIASLPAITLLRFLVWNGIGFRCLSGLRPRTECRLVGANGDRTMINGEKSMMRARVAAGMFVALSLLTAAPAGAEGPVHAGASRTADERLRRLYDAEWSWRLAQFGRVPGHGPGAYADHLPRVEPASQRARLAYWERAFAELDTIPRASISAEERINAAVFREEVEELADEVRFRTYEAPFNSDTFFWSELAPGSALANVEEYRRYLGRLRDLPRYFDEQIANMRAGIARGYTVPRVTLVGRDRTMEPFLAADAANPLYASFRTMPASIGAEDQARLRAEALAVIREFDAPAYRKLLTMFRQEYLPRARTTIAASALPDGADFYQAQILHFTTLEMSPREIHEIGLREVARIRAEMEATIRRTGFKGSFAEFIRFLRM